MARLLLAGGALRLADPVPILRRRGQVTMHAAQPRAVVTGAGSGIGRALSLALASRGMYVVAVGRRREVLQETRQLCEKSGATGAVEDLAADVASAEGRAAVAQRLAQLCRDGGGALSCVVHNAAVVGELGSMEQLTPAGFQRTMAINVEGPLFLTQALKPNLGQGSRVLHISSGAAHRPLEGCLTYCTSKAALLQVMRCLDEELAPSGARVGSVMPGVVDTPMQVELRSQEFASSSYFKQLGQAPVPQFAAPAPPTRQGLDTPENVASFLAWLLNEVPLEEFGGREWNIGDPETQQRWLSQTSGL